MKKLIAGLLVAIPFHSMACELLPTADQAFKKLKQPYATPKTFKDIISFGTFEEYDANKDGKVTKEEYSEKVVAYYTWCDKIQSGK